VVNGSLQAKRCNSLAGWACVAPVWLVVMGSPYSSQTVNQNCHHLPSRSPEYLQRYSRKETILQGPRGPISLLAISRGDAGNSVLNVVVHETGLRFIKFVAARARFSWTEAREECKSSPTPARGWGIRRFQLHWRVCSRRNRRSLRNTNESSSGHNIYVLGSYGQKQN
jgi:hypothetical protein